MLCAQHDYMVHSVQYMHVFSFWLQPLNEVVEGVVMEFLKTREGPFTLSSLTSSKELREAVWEGVQQEGEGVGEGEGGKEGKGKVTEEEVSKELSMVVKRMPQLGLVIPTNPTTLKLEVEYEVQC